jgi:flavodoxin
MNDYQAGSCRRDSCLVLLHLKNMRRMKNITEFALIIMTTICLLSGCSTAQEPLTNKKASEQSADKKVLIVYLSRTNNTKAIAEIINKSVGGTLIAIELEKPYPEDYKATVEQVVKENETGFLPPLKTKIENIEQYDVVFLGFPTWGMKLPPPVKSFLRQYNLKGKTVIPFNTNGGYGEGSSFETIKELCPESKIMKGFVIRGGLERDGELLVIKDEKKAKAEIEVQKWLREIEIMK